MNELMQKEAQATISSLDVAGMVEREHKEVLRDLRNIKTHLAESKIALGEYFTESTYLDANNQNRPCFNLTKKGCELYATRMTGAKGTLFAVKYIERFNEMEQALQQPQLPTTYKEALLQLVAQVEENEKLQTENLVLVQQNNELQPKASYYDLVLQNKSLLTVTQIAKDYGMSGMALNKLLHELGVQYKKSDTWFLYSKYQSCGYTQTTTHVIDDETSKINTKWTQKGRLFIYDLLKANGTLPMIEREETEETA